MIHVSAITPREKYCLKGTNVRLFTTIIFIRLVLQIFLIFIVCLTSLLNFLDIFNHNGD
jgi:hypothetical protein